MFMYFNQLCVAIKRYVLKRNVVITTVWVPADSMKLTATYATVKKPVVDIHKVPSLK